jgi:hypothetical protein
MDKAVLQLGYMRVLISTDAAMQILKILSLEDKLLMLDYKYVKDEITGNHANVPLFAELRSDEVGIRIITAAEILIRQANSEVKA